MWLSPWAAKTAVGPIFLALFFQATLASTASAAPSSGSTPPSAHGPRSLQEADYLFKQGKADWEAQNLQEAVRKLQRLVDRYPSAPGASEARLYLGQAYLSTGKPQAALSPLRAFLQSRPQELLSQSARLALGSAYIALKKFNEAYLTTLELLSQPESLTPKGVETSALLLRARALLGLNQDERVKSTLASARSSLDASVSQRENLRQQLESLELALRLRECSSLPSSGRLTEAQALEQLGRRGDCLAEGAVILQRAFLEKAGESPTGVVPDSPAALDELAQSAQLFEQAWVNFQAACMHPPKPPGKRSPKELNRYRAELSSRLSLIFREKKSRALEVLALPVATETPGPVSSQDNLAENNLAKDPLSPARRKRLAKTLNAIEAL